MLGHWRGGVRSSAADLAAALRLLLLDGQLPPGTRVPSERELATATGTSRALTTAAYDRLRADGLLASRRGAGSWTTLPCTGRGGHLAPGPDHLVDLAHAAPSAPAGLAAAAEAVRPAFAAQLGGHGYSPQGLPDLRARIADRYTARGLPTSPEQVLVTSGAQHAFGLVLRTLTVPGDRVLVENPTYPNALDAVRAAHARTIAVGLDADTGWDVDALGAALRRSTPALAYLIPDFQNPTGLRMPEATRADVAIQLRATRTPVVVDETLVELDLDGGPVPSPLAAAVGDLAITVGSASKTFWGGLRLGWLRAPADVVARLVAARSATDLGCPVFEQLLLAELLDRPDLLPPRLDALRAAARRAARRAAGALSAVEDAAAGGWAVAVVPARRTRLHPARGACRAPQAAARARFAVQRARQARALAATAVHTAARDADRRRAAPRPRVVRHRRHRCGRRSRGAAGVAARSRSRGSFSHKWPCGCAGDH
jgi:DNA-binding transcriptional MocR family regulator